MRSKLTEVKPASRSQSSPHRAKDPWREPFERHERLPVSGDDRLAFAVRHSAEHLPHGFRRAHHELARNRVGRSSLELSLIVDASDVARDKTWRDQRHRHAREPQLRRDGVRQRANGKLAHRIR